MDMTCYFFCNSSTCCIYLLLCGFRTTDIIRDPAPVLDYHSSPSHSHLARTNSFSTTRSTSHTSLLEREHRALAPEYRPMTQIEELKESSRPGTRHGGEPQSWAITHLGMKENTVNKSKFIYLSSFCSAKLRSALPMISDAKFFLLRTIDAQHHFTMSQNLIEYGGMFKRQKLKSIAICCLAASKREKPQGE